MENIITIERIKGIELEDHKLFLEKWSIGKFVKYCILQIDYLSFPDSLDFDPSIRNTKFLFSKTRGLFYNSTENWKNIEDYFNYHRPIMYAAYDNCVIKSISIEDAINEKIDDDNSDMIPKLHEFIYLYGKECANK